jgi:hypothetical protein
MRDGLSEEEQRLLLSFRLDSATGRVNARGRIRSTREYGARARRPGQPPAPVPGSYAAIISEFEQCGPQISRQRAMQWARAIFTPDQVRAWMRAGLRTSDLELVTELRDLGVRPEAMGLTVRKLTMLDRVRYHGYTAGQVARTLRAEGPLSPRAA